MISAAAERTEARAGRGPRGRRPEPVGRVECSAEMPWGIHAALETHRCPRCGWHRS